MANEYHVQMNAVASDGSIKKIYPVSNAADIKVTNNNQNLPSGTTNVDDVLSKLGSLAFQNSSELQADTENIGLVKLSNSTTDVTDTSTAATTAAVSVVAEVATNSVQKSGDQIIEGVKQFSDGMQVGNTHFQYSADDDNNQILTVDFI